MNHNQSGADSTKHMLIMIACCLIPLALILAIGAFGLSLGALTPFLPYALLLLCPLSMFFMMRGMGHREGGAEGHHEMTGHTSAGAEQGKVLAGRGPGSEKTESCH